MPVLLDTNPLLRASQPEHPMSTAAVNAITALLLRDADPRVAPQNLIEYWGAATRPAGTQNGLGMSPAQAEQEIERIKQQFPLLPDCSDIYSEWERLVRKYAVTGRQVHDARIVAVMRVYGISQILTFNGRDFQRYANEGILVLDPEAFALSADEEEME